MRSKGLCDTRRLHLLFNAESFSNAELIHHFSLSTNSLFHMAYVFGSSVYLRSSRDSCQRGSTWYCMTYHVHVFYFILGYFNS